MGNVKMIWNKCKSKCKFFLCKVCLQQWPSRPSTTAKASLGCHWRFNPEPNQSINQSIINVIEGSIPLIFHALVPQDIHTRFLLISIWSLSILSHSAIISSIRFTTCIHSRKERFFSGLTATALLVAGGKVALGALQVSFHNVQDNAMAENIWRWQGKKVIEKMVRQCHWRQVFSTMHCSVE